MTLRRRRFRASDAAPNPKKGLASLLMFAVGLALIIGYKLVGSEETASFLETLARDPLLELPPSVLDQDRDTAIDYGLQRD